MNVNSRWLEQCFNVSSLRQSRTLSFRLSVCFYYFSSWIEQLILHCTQNDKGWGQTTERKNVKNTFCFSKRRSMSSESPRTIFSAFIISDSVFSQSWSSETALSNFGHGDARSEKGDKKSLDHSSDEARASERASDLTMMLRAEYSFDTTNPWESQRNPNAPSRNQTTDMLPQQTLCYLITAGPRVLDTWEFSLTKDWHSKR